MPKRPFHKVRLVPDDNDGPNTESIKSPCFTCGATGKCNTCSGSGSETQFLRCGQCKGSGTIQANWFSPYAKSTCPSCLGTGQVPTQFNCDTCGGSGKCQVCGGTG